MSCLSIAEPANDTDSETSSWTEDVAAAARILLADDQEEMLHAVARILENNFDVVGTVGDGESALELMTILAPDVVVLDICMPQLSGIEVASQMKELELPTRVVFLTVYEDRDFVDAALSVGAFGYVLKSCLMTDLVPAILAALAGDIFVSPVLRRAKRAT